RTEPCRHRASHGACILLSGLLNLAFEHRRHIVRLRSAFCTDPPARIWGTISEPCRRDSRAAAGNLSWNMLVARQLIRWLRRPKSPPKPQCVAAVRAGLPSWPGPFLKQAARNRIHHLIVNRGTCVWCVRTTLHLYKRSITRLKPEAAMTTLEFIALLYVVLCIGATIGFVIAGLLANASKY